MHRVGAIFVVVALAVSAAPAAATWIPSHVVVVVEENHSFADIIGNPDAPYINGLAAGGALFTSSHAVEHPSQPNYLDLFSGSNQGVTTDNPVPGTPLTTPNLGASLIAHGDSFAGYSEGLPSVGSLALGTLDGNYQRKHNPWSNWQSAAPGPNQLAPSTNRPFSSFPIDFNALPTVSFVIPNQSHDGHGAPGSSTSDAQLVADTDSWLRTNIDAYRQWAQTHDSLLVVTWDEDSSTPIPTIFSGSGVIQGRYGQPIDHFDVLRTIEDFYDLAPSGAAAEATPITNAFTRTAAPPPVIAIGAPSSVTLSLLGLSMIWLGRRMAGRRRYFTGVQPGPGS